MASIKSHSPTCEKMQIILEQLFSLSLVLSCTILEEKTTIKYLMNVPNVHIMPRKLRRKVSPSWKNFLRKQDLCKDFYLSHP